MFFRFNPVILIIHFVYNIAGDIAFRYIKYLQNLGPSQGTHSSVTVCDINQAMLDVGKQRAQK